MGILTTEKKKIDVIDEAVTGHLRKYFEIVSDKRSRITACILGALCLALIMWRADSFINQEFAGKWLLLAAVMVAVLLIIILTLYTIRIKNELLNEIWHFAALFLMPILTVTMSECLNGVFVYNMTYAGFFANYILILMLYFLFFGLFGNFKVAYITVDSIIYLFALAHSYIVEFRGTPFLPMDFLSIETAAGVAGTYDFTPNYKVVTATVLFVLLIVIACKTNTPNFKMSTKLVSRVAMLITVSVLFFTFFFTDYFTEKGFKPDFWNQTRGYGNYGFAWSFFCNTKYLYMSEPNNYNADEVGGYITSLLGDDDDDDKTVVSTEKPNVICIMNESLADLSVLGDFETNIEYMPFLNSLTENTVKGNLYVPVIGAGTSNTEFEFLTGHSTAFLPSGSNAYMLYVKNAIASLVSTMESQNYSSYALHPYYKAGWNRESVYTNFGFDTFDFLEDIMDISLMQMYQENDKNADYLQSLVEAYYPGNDNMIIRQYISDDYNYQLIIEDFENRDTTKPYFMFNVTMQNHGGYTTSCINFEESVYTTSTQKSYNKTNKYLSLVKASDDAFKELVEYFSAVDEPTVILMFGDHQPSVENKFISEIMGVSDLSNLTIEQEQSRYCTPFYIWANYDIEEEYVEALSVNYLSSLLLEVAGIEMTDYNKYLLRLKEILPVINTAGYIDANGVYYSWNDDSPYKVLLAEYERVQYNAIFDTENVRNELFYINN